MRFSSALVQNGIGGDAFLAGFVTEAGRHGASPFKFKDHGRHNSLEVVTEDVREGA